MYKKIQLLLSVGLLVAPISLSAMDKNGQSGTQNLRLAYYREVARQGDDMITDLVACVDANGPQPKNELVDTLWIGGDFIKNHFGYDEMLFGFALSKANGAPIKLMGLFNEAINLGDDLKALTALSQEVNQSTLALALKSGLNKKINAKKAAISAAASTASASTATAAAPASAATAAAPASDAKSK